jgi:mediator of RNA polymerase II transcription subunit 12
MTNRPTRTFFIGTHNYEIESLTDYSQLTRNRLNVLLRLTAVHCPELMAKAPNQHQAALLWTLRTILSHSCIASSPATAVFVFDVTTLLSDSISEDVRKHLAKLDTSKSMSDARCAFIFGASSSTDAWLSLMQPVASPSVAWVAAPSPQVLPQATNTAQGQWQGQHQITPVSGPMQRTSSQHTYQQQMQSQAQARAYSHYQQHIPGQKMFPQQLQRMGSNGQGVGNMMHLQQQQQQMQALAQQRQMQPASTQQQQRAAATSSPQQQQQTIGAKSNVAKQDKVEMKQVPFTLNRWEILPESGGNPVGNETAISLSLFGARRA